jgi:hypothetical protein
MAASRHNLDHLERVVFIPEAAISSGDLEFRYAWREAVHKLYLTRTAT